MWHCAAFGLLFATDSNKKKHSITTRRAVFCSRYSSKKKINYTDTIK